MWFLKWKEGLERTGFKLAKSSIIYNVIDDLCSVTIMTCENRLLEPIMRPIENTYT